MTIRKTLVLSAATLLAVMIAAFMFLFLAASQPYAASAAGGDVGDYSTTTTSAMASPTATVQLKANASVLGSVVISSSSPATTYSQIAIYDATSTMATSSARVLARFGTNNQTMGTYMFDAAAAYGLKMEVAPGYSGNATITWR